jgi:hypothetical protein
VRVIAVVGASFVACLDASTAFANAASPTESPMTAGSVVLNANKTVTVTASGNWVWQFGRESPTTQGLHATVNHPCDVRTGVGWGVAWSDPDDPGFPETYHSNKKVPEISQMVNVGSKGVNPANNDNGVMFNSEDPCGTFVQTNSPHPGDGYVTGTWTEKHVYASEAALPLAVCVITYDLGLAKPPGPHRTSFDNNDNSVQWALFTTGAWDISITDDNCAKLPPAVLAPPAPPAPVVKTVSHTAPPPVTTPPAVVTKPPATLAFTGFGRTGEVVAVIGAILVLIGFGLYFVDEPKARRAGEWLLGWSSPSGSRGAQRAGASWTSGRRRVSTTVAAKPTRTSAAVPRPAVNRSGQ